MKWKYKTLLSAMVLYNIAFALPAHALTQTSTQNPLACEFFESTPPSLPNNQLGASKSTSTVTSLSKGAVFEKFPTATNTKLSSTITCVFQGLGKINKQVFRIRMNANLSVRVVQGGRNMHLNPDSESFGDYHQYTTSIDSNKIKVTTTYNSEADYTYFKSYFRNLIDRDVSYKVASGGTGRPTGTSANGGGGAWGGPVVTNTVTSINNSETNSNNLKPSLSQLNDYDGDGIFDPAVWRFSNGTFYILPSSNNCPSSMSSHGPGCELQWGLPNDIAIAGDFDGDNKADPTVWRPSNGNYYVHPSSGQCPSRMTNHFTGCEVQWGLPGDTPITGDFDNDGRTDPAIWRSADAHFYVLPSTGRCPSRMIPFAHGCRAQWGLIDDVPIVADYDSDGVVDLAVWRPSTATYYILPSTNICPSNMKIHGPGCEIQFGDSNEIPIVGYFDNDSKLDIGTHDPFTFALKYLASSEHCGSLDYLCVNEGIDPDAIVFTADVNGDGIDDIVQVIDINGLLYFFNENFEGEDIKQWGLLTDSVLMRNTDYFPI